MVLLIAVFAGLLAGLIRAWIGKREYRYYELRFPWLVVVAFLPQFFAFYLPGTSDKLSDTLTSTLLVSSLALLLIFCLLNIKKLSFWPIIIGFASNFLVILLNGGLMPISPQTISRLLPEGSKLTYQIGQRLGTGKDIVLDTRHTILAFLSDRLVFPRFLNFPVAFSIGDALIALGVIWLFWSMGGPQSRKVVE
jgi:hypothetical protein